MSLMTETNESIIRYSLTLPEVSEPFSYRVSAGYAESDRYQILVETRPALTNMLVYYKFPSYTKLESKVETNSSGNIRSIAGTVIILDAEPTKLLSNMTLRVGSSAPVKGAISGDPEAPHYRWTINLKTNMAGPYSLELVDSFGFAGDPISRNVEVTSDDPPTVRLVAPDGEKIKVKPTELVKLVAAGVDDFGIGRSELLVSVDAEPQSIFPVAAIHAVEGQPGACLLEGCLDLSAMKLAGRSMLRVSVRVYDNRPAELGGGQSAVSSSLLIELDQSAESLVRQSLEAQEQALKKEVEQLAEAIRLAAESAKDADKKFEEQKGAATPEAMAAIDAAREKAATAENLAQAMADSVENTPLAGLKPALDKLIANNLAPARQAGDTIPLTDAGTQAPLADQMAQNLADASANAEALSQTMDAMNKQMETLATLAEMANRQQQLASAASAAASKAESQPIPGSFSKDESAVAEALAPLTGADADIPAAAQAASDAATAPSAAAAAPPAKKAAEMLAKAVSTMAATMVAASQSEGQAQGQNQDQTQSQSQAQSALQSQAQKGQQSQSKSQSKSQEKGQMNSPPQGGGSQEPADLAGLATMSMLGYSGTSSINWTKAKGISRSKVGGDMGMRVPPEYKEIVGRYFEELSRTGEHNR